MTSKILKPHRADMMHTLEQLQNDMADSWLDQSIPDEWAGMDTWFPVERHKTRVTIRLDSDMLRWFRKLGPNYSRRINHILRVYYCALLSGRIKAYEDDNVIPRIAAEVRRIREERLAEEAEREKR